MNIQVAVSLNISESLTYKWTGDILPRPGMRVVVPIGFRVVPGWITSTESTYKGRVKSITGYVDDSWMIPDEYMDFVKSVAELYFISPGTLLDYALSPGRKSVTSLRFDVDGKKKKISDYKPGELNKIAAGKGLCFFYNKPEEISNDLQLEESEKYRHDAIIGYRHVEKYMDIIEKDKKNGRNTLIIVPDSYTGIYLKDKLGEGDLYLSSLKVKERSEIWRKYTAGESGVLIGGLSALMLPSVNTGTVIFHRAGSYQYSGNSFTDYNLYEIARRKAEAFGSLFHEGGVLNGIVSSSTGERNFEDNRLEKDISISINMIKPGATELPPVIKEMLRDNYLKGKKTAVIMNKKHSSGYLFCKNCKSSKRCSSCGGGVTISSKPYGLSASCKNCGVSEDKVVNCSCGKEYIHVEKPGINSLIDIVKREITDKDYAIFTADELKKGEWNKNKLIFIGTPAIMTPVFNDFFDSVIVLRPENYVDLDSFNGAEMLKNFVSEMKELVVSGGKVEVFSVFHFHYSLQLVDSDESFMEREMNYREMFRLPPFANVYEAEIKSKSLRELASELRKMIKDYPYLGISKCRLKSRKSHRGIYRGILELHASPENIIQSGIVSRKDIFVKLIFS